MGNDSVVALAEFLTWGILGSAAFIVFLKAVTGGINLRGVLRGGDDGQGISPARVQLLFMTLIGAFGYLGEAMKAIAAGTDYASLPDPPTTVIAMLGGSHGLYLAAKGLATRGWLDWLRGNGQGGRAR